MKKLLFIISIVLCTSAFAQFPLAQQLSNQINYDSLIVYVKQLSGELPVSTPEGDKFIKSRLKGSEGNELSAWYIKQKLLSWGVPYEEKNFSATGQNIIGTIQGRRPGKIMLVGAHYDAVGTGSTAIFYPGADDNASGTAAVLEIARVCAQYQFPVSLHFAFWDEEEQGLVGSDATAPEYMQNKLVGYINMDMIAYDGNNDSSFDIHTRNSGHSVLMAQKVFDLINLYEFPLKPRLINPGDPATDHGSFWKHNLTAIGINEEYEGDFTPHWHKQSDSIAHFNLSYFHRMSQFAGLAFLHLALDSNDLVGIKEGDLMNDLVDVYPNPFENDLNISCPQNITLVKAQLFDLSGKQVQESFITNNKLNVNADVKKGFYYLLLFDDAGYVYRKKVVRN
jgi:hypothetical protein